MKKILVLLLALAMMSTCAVAENTSLSDFSNRLKKNTVEEVTTTALAGEDDGLSYGPAIRVSDPFFQKVRSSVYPQENAYSREINAMIELKNTSGRTLYPSKASMSAYNAKGELIDEETYASYGPEMVADGASLFIWDWFYGLEVPVAEVSYLEVKI